MNELPHPPPTAELVVIGGGAATAFHAARAGLKPLILEARPQLCTLTTTVAAGAFLLTVRRPRGAHLASVIARN